MATLDDVPQILEWGRKFHEMSTWSAENFDEDSARINAEFVINDSDHVIIVHEYGMIGGVIKKIYFSSSYVAQELFWYAEKGGQKLFDAFELWSYANGANCTMMASLPISEKSDRIIDKLYKKRGYTPQERYYYKKVVDSWD